jgi:hypothetical protein
MLSAVLSTRAVVINSAPKACGSARSMTHRKFE